MTMETSGLSATGDVLPGGAQRQRQRVHATGLDRSKFSGKRCVDRPRSCHAVHAFERLAHHQNAVMGLAKPALGTHMTGVVRAVVGYPQQLGRELRGERRPQTIGAISIHTQC
jgi:hypothetical protein